MHFEGMQRKSFLFLVNFLEFVSILERWNFIIKSMLYTGFLLEFDISPSTTAHNPNCNRNEPNQTKINQCNQFEFTIIYAYAHLSHFLHTKAHINKIRATLKNAHTWTKQNWCCEFYHFHFVPHFRFDFGFVLFTPLFVVHYSLTSLITVLLTSQSNDSHSVYIYFISSHMESDQINVFFSKFNFSSIHFKINNGHSNVKFNTFVRIFTGIIPFACGLLKHCYVDFRRDQQKCFVFMLWNAVLKLTKMKKTHFYCYFAQF